MCTTVAIRKDGLYFGRNMDIENHFCEEIIHTPRHFLIDYRHEMDSGGYSLLGIGTVIDGIPLYADAMNETGLCMAGLNFPYNAVYGKPEKGYINLAPYEMIPYLLRTCASISEVREVVKSINITDTPVNPSVPIPYLHFHIADGEGSIVLEPCENGIKIYDDPYDILTNNPPFPYQASRLSRYKSLKNHTPPATFYKKELYSLGLGAYGLPGDLSSPSRFARGEYLLKNLLVNTGEEVQSVFHVLEALCVPRGAVMNGNGEYHYTLYSCCADAKDHAYYVRPYDSLCVKGIYMNEFTPSGNELLRLSLL